MTVSEARTASTAPPIPRPRDAEPCLPEAAGTGTPLVPELPEAHYPWPEPWRSARGAQPRSEFWHAESGSWRSRGPVSAPRAD
ncbi:hypothetical protein [Blastococcus mobilis]|uniref:Uncharacterized protein n=1 Tax=Blastococcus mobilis TaxID=1938746 RepID=A0A238V5D3_9ACTN|nr:hypothetical protein [Blastococcus mobilis]SNR29294.1 hypothetical protein SAMN06272737_10237 [Blastococcus mobilis]